MQAAIVSTALSVRRDPAGVPYSIETVDGLHLADLSRSSGALGAAIVEEVVERWNGQHGEHITFGEFEATIGGAAPAQSLGSLALGLAGTSGNLMARLAGAVERGGGYLHEVDRILLSRELSALLKDAALLARALDLPLAAIACNAAINHGAPVLKVS